MTAETLRFISRGDGYWVLEGTEAPEGQSDPTCISRDDTFQTECDDPHPVRISRARREEWNRMSDWDKQQLSRSNWDEYWALLNNKRGWYCEGGEEHFYTQWTVRWDGEWTEDVYDSFGDAVAAIERATGKKVVKVTPRKPKAETAPEPEAAAEPQPETGALDEALQVLERAADKIVNGRRVWASCGHPAELDINNDCYTCHRAVA